MPLQLYFYKLAVLRGSEWICYQGYVFATSQNRAKSILSQRYLTGVIKEPFGANIEPGEDITFRTVERVPVEEGTCL